MSDARLAEIRAIELLNAARTMAKMAEELVNEHCANQHLMLEVEQSSGRTSITWYNSSESC
ncbi:hypothetical protein Acj9p076 [Acinetobacter phage Acj9]|uniref:Uncharacterized protein n=1 Tax=Acinetobacter phage Acj9 TaxID=760939 RepID=E5EPL0_9CAUD|nr:hypothetical protein Acj9p076 [Acinetobacter phage Acj9]ADG59976.1 hypothetical protein Acj9p076 [Acinetobacter phage Acj9]